MTITSPGTLADNDIPFNSSALPLPPDGSQSAAQLHSSDVTSVSWDYIVIGAGSAGCALAHELVGSGKRVLVLEAGGSDRSALIKLPSAIQRAKVKFDWGYRSQPDPSRNGAAEHWTRGKVLGGSSSINGTIYAPAPARDFDNWSKSVEHQGGWSGNEIMPLFREMERSDQPVAGHDGPLHVRSVKYPHPITRAFMRSAVAAGYPLNDNYNANSQEGVAYAQLTQRRGFRWSASDAFLKPVLRRSNLRLLLHTTVSRIDMVKGKARGVVFHHDGREQYARASDIVLCAGAINSPKLLMLSGIGDPVELRRHNIDVLIDLPGVGRNLSEHPLLRLSYKSKIPTYNPTEGILQKVSFASRFLWCGEGPIASPFEGIGFVRSAAIESAPDIILYFVPIGFRTQPDGSLGAIAPFPSVMVYAAKSYPVSRGRIRLAGRDPAASPLIECELLSAQEDVETLVRSIGTIRRIMSTKPIADLIDEEMTPGPQVQSPAELERYVRRNTGISMHPVGTCKMGLDAMAVVGADLRVRGTENLWIADASIAPDHMSANMNAVCMMLGLKLGKQLTARPTSGSTRASDL
jgi:choline dehydrogenase